MNTTKVIISTKNIILLLSLLILVWIIYQSKDVIMLLFASFIIASALYPIVEWLNRRMPRGAAVALIYAAGFIILATMLIPLTAVLIEQTQEFLKQLPTYWTEVYKFIEKMQIRNMTWAVSPDFSQILSTTTNLGQNILNQSINITISFFGGILAAFTLASIVLFLLLDRRSIKKSVLKFFPENSREKTATIITAISQKVGGYVAGRLIMMIFVGISVAVSLSVINIKFALLLGMLAGIMEIIPIVGPTLATTIATLIALAQSPELAVATIIIFIVVQAIQNYALTPLVFGKFLDLHPLIIIIALLISASTLGIIGAILSPAIAAAVYVLIHELYLIKINPK